MKTSGQMSPGKVGGSRLHLVSAGMAMGYLLALHLLLWLSVSVTYLAVPTSGIPYIVVPSAVLLVGLIAFIRIKSLPPERITFYVALLVGHILLSMLFLTLSGSLIDWLGSLRGVPAPDSPDGDLSSLYFLLAWVLLAPGMGLLFFILAVAFLLRDALRQVMGDTHREKKKPRKK